MARSKLPMALANLTGAAIKNPKRYKGGAIPAVGALGAPYPAMTPEEQTIWGEFAVEFPWLQKSDRAMTAIACRLVARSNSPKGLSMGGVACLRIILNSFGGLPTSEARRRFVGAGGSR